VLEIGLAPLIESAAMNTCRARLRFAHQIRRSLSSLVALACALACASQPAEPPASGATPAATAAGPSTDPAANGIIDRRGKGGASVFVAHQVSDFDAFKKFFDDGGPEREKAGVKGHLLTRLDDGRVVVHLFANDLDAVKMTLESPTLKEYLNRSGAPDKSLVWLAYDELIKIWPKPPAVPTFSLYLKLSVADLPALRDGFVRLQSMFAEQSVIASGLHHSVDQADLVFLHFVGTNHDQLGALAQRPEFSDWLQKCGSTGTPKSFLGTDVSRSRTYYDDFQ
jgi:hypothetical protein